MIFLPSQRPHRQKGSALLAALCFCAVLGIVLASYLSVCSQTLRLSNRNSQGTHSVELAETGMEEALWALNKDDWADWTVTGSSPKTATKTLTGFSYGNGVTGTLTIKVENADGRVSNTDPTLNVTGTITLADGSTVTRKLKATAKLAPLFVNAVAAIFRTTDANSYRGVEFSAGGLVDSIDSNLLMPTAEEEFLAKFSAVVSSANRVTLTETEVSGYVAVATQTPSTPETSAPLLFSYSGNARVEGPNSPTATPIDQSRLSSSPYQPVFDIKELSDPEIAAASTVPLLEFPSSAITIGNADPTVSTLYYQEDGLRLTDAQSLTIQGRVVLYVSGDFTIEGSAKIIVPLGSSLQIVVTQKSFSDLSIGGQGIENGTGKAKSVAILYNSSPNPDLSVGNPTISTTQPFSGVIYAPDLDVVVSSSLEFTGAIVAKTVHFSGTPAFHYDIDLRRPTTKFSYLETPFMVSSWQEIVP